VLALAAFLKLQRHTFFGSLPERFKAVREAPLAMCLPMVLLAALCVGIGLAFPFFIDNFLDKAATTLAVLVSVR
jgi:formate hydrogenlyase subunit 3/multisubunit Na+/H+ antiporter MnhD subunit